MFFMRLQNLASYRLNLKQYYYVILYIRFKARLQFTQSSYLGGKNDSWVTTHHYILWFCVCYNYNTNNVKKQKKILRMPNYPIFYLNSNSFKVMTETELK